MNRNMLTMTALGLGAAYLMRNKETREKLKNQVNDLTQNGDGKGMLDQVLGAFDKKNTDR